jgi:ribosomal protein S24E
MAIEITSDKKNQLLGRRELEFTLPGKLTPSRKETKADLAKALNVPENLIVIDTIVQRTGSNITLGKAKVYANEAILKSVTLDYKNKRGEKKKDDTAPAAPTEKK